MTNEAFIEKTRRDLAVFEAWWKSMRKEDPENFPNDATEGDWLEQFHIFQELQDR